MISVVQRLRFNPSTSPAITHSTWLTHPFTRSSHNRPAAGVSVHVNWLSRIVSSRIAHDDLLFLAFQLKMLAETNQDEESHHGWPTRLSIRTHVAFGRRKPKKTPSYRLVRWGYACHYGRGYPTCRSFFSYAHIGTPCQKQKDIRPKEGSGS